VSGAWIVRAASAARWGGGHVSRCRALAAALRERAPVAFVLDEDDGGWRAKLQADGFQVLKGTPRETVAGCVLDHYDLPSHERAELRSRAPFIASLHDHGPAPADVDLLIAPGWQHHQDDSRIPALCGPTYALLDARFRSAPRPAVRKSVRTIVLAFGLSDSANLTSLALASLAEAGMTVDVVIALGGRARHRHAVERKLSEFSGRVRLAIDEPDMPSLLATADLVLGAGGVGLYERMCLGVPSITLIAAENQRAAAVAAGLAGCTLTLDSVESLETRELAGALRRLADDHAARAEQSARGRLLVDGFGAVRAAAALIEAQGRSAATRTQAGR
jgi:spore coat polysaccharide biosynthesis predicted glycosyltransferase SpsG